MNRKIKKIAENLGWNVNEYNNGAVELRKYSPAGEEAPCRNCLRAVYPHK